MKGNIYSNYLVKVGFDTHGYLLYVIGKNT